LREDYSDIFDSSTHLAVFVREWNMSALSKILSILVAIVGVLSAIKTLAPSEMTYIDFFKSSIFLSGWGVTVVLAMVIIYQEERNKAIKTQDENILMERSVDKDYLKSELSKSNISLNHLTSRLGTIERPIPKATRQGENDDF